MGRAHEKWHICKCLVFHAENLLKVYTQKNSGYTKSRRKIRQQKIPKIDSKFLHIELLSREAWASKDTRFLTLSFPITERAVQKQLSLVCDYLGYQGISTHSFRKWYATEIYKANGYDIALVQRLLQHSSAAVTQRYIGIEPQRIEAAIQNHAQLL